MDSIGSSVYTIGADGASDYTYPRAAPWGTSGCTRGNVSGVTLADRLRWILENRTRGGGPSPEDAAIVAAALRGDALSIEEWREVARSIGVDLVRRELGGPRAVLSEGVLFLAP